MWRPTRTHGAAIWTYLDPSSHSGPSSGSSSPGSDEQVFQHTYSSIDIPGDIADKVPLQNETFGWIDGQFKMHNHTDAYPEDGAVTQRIWLNNQQIKWGADGKALRWAVNGRLYNDTVPRTPILLNIYDKSMTPDCESF